MNPSIKNISTFGSSVRDDVDELSDIDVLVLVKDGGGTVSEDDVLIFFKPEYHSKISISWYGKKKLSEMFESGHLFSWHLFEESKPLGDFLHLSEVMGKPKPYSTGINDIQGLVELLESSKKAFKNYTPNVIYELGLVYLAARNIAMSASWHLSSKPYFGRYSPYKICKPTFPIGIDEYNILMKCRMASQRGLLFDPNKDIVNSVDTCEAILEWSRLIQKEVKNALQYS